MMLVDIEHLGKMKSNELWKALDKSLPRRKGRFNESKKDKIVVVKFRAGDLYYALADWAREYQSLVSRLGGARSILKIVEARVPKRVKRAERIYKALEVAWRASKKK
jgi:hypothetical protein